MYIFMCSSAYLRPEQLFDAGVNSLQSANHFIFFDCCLFKCFTVVWQMKIKTNFFSKVVQRNFVCFPSCNERSENIFFKHDKFAAATVSRKWLGGILYRHSARRRFHNPLHSLVVKRERELGGIIIGLRSKVHKQEAQIYCWFLPTAIDLVVHILYTN